MKLADLFEMPQLIKSLSPVDTKLLIDECNSALRNKSAKVVKSMREGTDLFHVAIPGGGIYFLKSDDIDYICRYREVELPHNTVPGNKAIRQVLIHRCRTSSVFSAGMPHDIFWNELYKKCGVLVSDSEQTDDGRKFWLFQVREAMKRGLTVRFIDTNSATYDDANNMDELDDLMRSSYGYEKWFRRVVIAIFRTEAK